MSLAESLQREFDAHYSGQPDRGDSELCEWLMGEMVQLDALEATIKEQMERALNTVKRRKDALQYVYGHQFNAAARRLLDEARAKHVDLPTGRIQARTTKPKPQIVDEPMALQWAGKYLRHAVDRRVVIKLDKPTIFLHVTETGEVPPGVEMTEERTTIYPRMTTDALPEPGDLGKLTGDEGNNG